MVLNALLLACSVVLLANATGLVVIWMAAAAMALAMVQTGFVGHDALHGQIVRTRSARFLFGLVHWNLLTGISTDWWQDKHVRHHLHTNVLGADPDMYTLLTFSRTEALGKRGLARFIARRQAWCFIPLLAGAAAYFRWLSVAHLLRSRPRGFVLELSLITLHHGAYLGCVFHFLPPLPAAGFVILNYGLTGLYMGAVFSTNHLAMPLADPAPDTPRIQGQLNCSRNIETGRIGDFLFGGLNYQIEHHLFPSMPRLHFRAASGHVRAFCRRHGLPYHSCDMRTAAIAIARELHDVGSPLRLRGGSAC